MAKHSSPGQSVVSRLAERDQAGLYRRQMPNGGEVYTGPTASRALKALGARAFTMDRSIFVSEDFDPSDPEDQALYAHERHHQINSGGDGAAQSYYDGEERAARAVERMVLHRAANGEDFGTLLRAIEDQRIQSEGDVQTIHRSTKGGGSRAGVPSKSRGGVGGTGSGMQDPAEAAFQALLANGKAYPTIVRELTDACIETIATQETDGAFQGGSTGFV
jgi:hypothetical protein